MSNSRFNLFAKDLANSINKPDALPFFEKSREGIRPLLALMYQKQ